LSSLPATSSFDAVIASIRPILFGFAIVFSALSGTVWCAVLVEVAEIGPVILLVPSNVLLAAQSWEASVCRCGCRLDAAARYSGPTTFLMWSSWRATSEQTFASGAVTPSGVGPTVRCRVASLSGCWMPTAETMFLLALAGCGVYPRLHDPSPIPTRANRSSEPGHRATVAIVVSRGPGH
jgi:hypothetical protein